LRRSEDGNSVFYDLIIHLKTSSSDSFLQNELQQASWVWVCASMRGAEKHNANHGIENGSQMRTVYVKGA
jgi:hypothetical protein